MQATENTPLLGERSAEHASTNVERPRSSNSEPENEEEQSSDQFTLPKSKMEKKIQWFLYEFGLTSVYATGRDAWLIILTRALRMFGYGTNSLIIALFFNALNFSDSLIGLFMTLTLLGDVCLSFLLTLVADRIGRRNILITGSLLMVLSGIAFASSENFWVLLAAAVVGVISPTGSEIGPFRAVEESTISHLTTGESRSDVLSWYVTTASLGSALGSFVCGYLLDGLEYRGWGTVEAYHAIFWIYSGAGAVNIVFLLFLSPACEANPKPAQPAQEAEPLIASSSQQTLPAKKKPWFLPNISPSSRTILISLSLLFSLDSLGGGMSPWSFITYYLSTKFAVSKAGLGSIASACYVLAGISTLFAAPLARRIGLIKTMVLTHLPSSIALSLLPLPTTVAPTVGLLLFRASFSSMDQAPRAAFVAAVVKPEERTAVMGWNSVVRTLAQSAGPTLTGVLAGRGRFWAAFVGAGVLKGSYDVFLWIWGLNLDLEKGRKGEQAGKKNGDEERDADVERGDGSEEE
jgi:MFS family permease